VNLSQFCIHRPVFTIALNLVVVVIGLISFTRLPLRELPSIDTPVIGVSTEYPGASAKVVERDVTTPIEDAISGVNGINIISSSSSQGQSNIRISFRDNYDINVAMNDIRDKLSPVTQGLPIGIKTPTVSKSDSDSSPTIIISVLDSKRDSLQLTDYVQRSIKPLMQQVEGVSRVSIAGQRSYVVHIGLDPEKMAARKVDVNDVVTKLQAQNRNVPAGQIKGTSRVYPININGRLQNVAQFNELTVRDKEGMVTQFKDIAKVKVMAENISSAFRINGKAGVALAVVPESTANPIDVSNGVKEAIKQISVNLPPSMKVEVVYDNANFIKLSIHEVYHSLLEALILVIVIVLLFLGSIRSTLIPVATIPVCLITIFAGLYAFSYSINTITLLAMVLAIGLVVDDAIVMLENIYRHIENGMAPFAAALKGSKEIVFAIIAMTLTLVAVYLPITFTPGVTGVLFRQFALTLAGTVVISGFVALTLSPMMSARLLRPIDNDTRYAQWLERFAAKLMGTYRYLLTRALQHRLWIVVILLVLALLGGWLYSKTPTELAPMEDRGEIYGAINGSSNSSFTYVDHYVQQIEDIYARMPQVNNYLMMVNANEAHSILLLKPWDQRQMTQKQISEQLQKEFNNIPGVEAYAVGASPLSSGSNSKGDIGFYIMSSISYENLLHLSVNLAVKLLKYPGLRNIRTNMHMDQQQFNISINRDLAASLHVGLNTISNTIATFFGGSKASKFEFDGRNYDVIVQMQRKDLKDLQGLDKIYLRSSDDNHEMIPLSRLVNVTTTQSMASLPHYKRLRANLIMAQLAPGYTVGQVVDYLQKFMKANLPANASYVFSGATEKFLQSHSHMQMIFLLALAFIYLVLAAQFESFIDPLIVLLGVPLSIVGGLLVLRAAGGTLNIYSQIALVTLIGLIAKHGILITEFANQLRAQGKDIYDAIVEASAMRLRPILMTTAAMALGALPLALASGAGAASRHQVGWVIVGGILVGTFFSLFVVPTAYIYLARLQRTPRFIKHNQ